MNGFSILDPHADGYRWQSLCDRLQLSIIHFSPAYARAQMSHYGRVLLAVFEDGDEFMMQPFEMRDHDGLVDLHSPYGYGGLIGDVHSMWKEMDVEFAKWRNDYSVICERHVLHPRMVRNQNNMAWIERNVAPAERIKDTVVVRCVPENELNLRDTRRHCIRKARERGMVARRANPQFAELSTFYRLYCETMDRQNASSRWRFPMKYFTEYFREMPDRAVLVDVAAKDGTVLSSAIVLLGGPHAQYQFAGNSGVDGASDLLILKAVEIARECGAEVLDLGGGATSEQDDSLLNYKRSFSHERWPVMVCKRVFDQTRYDAACAGKPLTDFFPAYRSAA